MATNFLLAGREAGSGPLLGTIVTLADARLVELCALAGCDWIFLDCEHGAIGPADLGRVLCGSAGTPVLVRVAADEEYLIKQALDAGCAGIICPQVGDAATARRIVAAAKYPPLGRRSVGIGRAHGYGLSFADHLRDANDTTCVVAQIESRAGVRNIEEIIAVPGIDAAFVGPYDLSADLGRPGETGAPEVTEAVRHVIETCGRAGVPVGQFFADVGAYALSPFRRHCDFAAIGIDTVTLAGAVRTTLATARGTT